MSLETVLLGVGSGETPSMDRLAEAAIDIAGPAGATVALAHVFSEEGYEDTRERLHFDPDSEVTPDVVAERNVRIRELADQLADAGVDYTVHGRLAGDGDAGDRIAEIADEIGADLVIVGGRGRTPAGKAVFGSTAQTVMLNASCPVTYVREA
ncbi:universal stress protein [Halohasta salina]|uniref:universal stress protein n=1 Tax=Halohasta salina TaxID=2961621 RepID=UPI0020A3EE02|nr:universal stress protein [Halohasta salina]